MLLAPQWWRCRSSDLNDRKLSSVTLGLGLWTSQLQGCAHSSGSWPSTQAHATCASLSPTTWAVQGPLHVPGCSHIGLEAILSLNPSFGRMTKQAAFCHNNSKEAGWRINKRKGFVLLNEDFTKVLWRVSYLSCPAGHTGKAGADVGQHGDQVHRENRSEMRFKRGAEKVLPDPPSSWTLILCMCKFVGTNSNFLSAFKLLALNEGPEKQSIRKQRSPACIPHSGVASRKGRVCGAAQKAGMCWSWPRWFWVTYEWVSFPDSGWWNTEPGQPDGQEAASGCLGGERPQGEAVSEGDGDDACLPTTQLWTERCDQSSTSQFWEMLRSAHHPSSIKMNRCETALITSLCNLAHT